MAGAIARSATIDTAWLGRIVFWLIVSPLVGTGLAVMLRHRPAAALRSAILMNVLSTAVIGTGLNLLMSVRDVESLRADSSVVHWTTWTIHRSSPDLHDVTASDRDQSQSAQKRVAPWLEVEVSFGWDRLNGTALLWIPWLALSALLVTDAPLDRPALYYGLFCAWEACLLGCFAAYDALTFLAFDAAALWLGCALVGGWGQAQRRAAAGKFWRHQFAGNCAWFVGLVGLGVMTAWCHYYVRAQLPALSWTWQSLTEQLPRVVRSSWEIAAYFESASPVLFLLLAFGVLVRTPLIPLHSWWPMFAAEAPSPVAVLASVAWCPLGMYAWMRFVAPAFSESIAAHAGQLAFLGELTAVVSGLLALAQTDLRRYAAYAGLCLQGIAWISASTGTIAGNWGALALSQAAGLGVAGWLLLIAMLERRYLAREVDAFGGMAARLPRFAIALAAVAVVVCGFPALARVQIDLLIGWTLAENRPWGLVAAVVGSLTVAWGGVWMLQRLLLGQVREPVLDHSPFGATSDTISMMPQETHDLSWTECLALAPLVAWCGWTWLQPLPAIRAEDSPAAVTQLQESMLRERQIGRRDP